MTSVFCKYAVIFLKVQHLLATSLMSNRDNALIDERLVANIIDSRQVGVVFCDLKFADSYVRKIMNYNIPVIIGVGGDIAMNYENRENVTILVFTDSAIPSLTEECVSSIPRGLLIFSTTLVIHDMSLRPLAYFSEEGNRWWYLGSADVLYFTGNQCWQASPPYMFNRTFSKAQSCSIWNMNNQYTPDMQGQTIEAVTFHRPLSTIINFNETVPTSKYIVFSDIFGIFCSFTCASTALVYYKIFTMLYYSYVRTKQGSINSVLKRWPLFLPRLVSYSFFHDIFALVLFPVSLSLSLIKINVQ